MKEIEISARNVEEATKQALAKLGLRLDQVEIEVLEEGKSGLLGIGAEDARIRVTENANRIGFDEAAEMTQDILENLLAYMGLDAHAELQKDSQIIDDASGDGSQPVMLNIKGNDLGILIGRRGQTLSSLQYILRLIAMNKTGQSMTLVLDVNSYKKRRFESLKTLAHSVAEQVEHTGRSCALEPMPAYERRVIHMALAEHPYVITESDGYGEDRRVVVFPR